MNASCGPPAPAIAAGAPRNAADVTAAAEETRARKRAKTVDNALVSDAELAASITREVAVASEHAAGTYGVAAAGAPAAGAPAWGVNLMRDMAALTANVATLTANVATLTANVGTLTANVGTLEGNVGTLSATVAGIDARQRLALAQRRNARKASSGGNIPFVQLVKVNVGVGPPLPGAAAQNPNNDAVGTTYPNALAPATLYELDSWTSAQISALAEWANDDFGIVDGDTVEVRKSKLLDHYLLE
eukprot:CAMPEP_0168745756 /NCGR_PEP_ID=MMETSP0724-20121128/14785_1 /TAXON_ID=265536 /ORGANISM="Amphiprora sp., Strain CCMP467" /LENGTH=245 /DNA_ID=CAMNT_0008793485 /DNA_START=101 /DNA_END=838 /DNA_ORIENTATION=-